MGGGVANKKDANTAAAGAFGAGQLDTNLANKNQGRADSLDETLYGKGGPMMRFLSGSDLNRSDLGGVYKQGFDQTVAAGEKEGSQAYKNIVGQANNSGVGLDSGLSFDAARKNALDKAAMKGSAYATAAGAQHDEALRNFWGATDSAATTANAARSGAIAGAGQAGQTYNNVYNTAGQYHQGAAAGIIGSAVGAAGQVGAAAMTGGASAPGSAASACPTGHCLIGTKNATKTNQYCAVNLKKGDPIEQMNGHYGMLENNPLKVYAAVVIVKTSGGRTTRVGSKHCFSLVSGGYVFADEAFGSLIRSRTGEDQVASVTPDGFDYVYPLLVGGDHTYICDDLWSLE
jgi:hypothetical protein